MPRPRVERMPRRSLPRMPQRSLSRIMPQRSLSLTHRQSITSIRQMPAIGHVLRKFLQGIMAPRGHGNGLPLHGT